MRLNQLGMEDECIKVYDVEKKELIGTYDTYVKAEKATGLNVKVLKGAVVAKTRRFSKLLNKEIAIRLARKK